MDARLHGIRLCALLLLAGIVRVSAGAERASRVVAPPVGAAKPAEFPGLHNVFRVDARLYSGSVPEGDVGFASLSALGIRTVISVDGARPDVDRARRFGLRYLHLPFGYDGCPTPRALEIIRAVRDLPGPIYLHCHHGKHRSPAAAALVHIALDGASNQEAVAFMKRAGTAPEYVGLYGGAASFRQPTTAQIDAAPNQFPSVAAIPPLAEAMVKIDERQAALLQSQKERWRAPREHPDILPPHEALQLRELFRELQRTDDVKSRPADFKQRLRSAEAGAAALEAALRSHHLTEADTAMRRTMATCASCHARYRNVPQAG
jgi:protein tyrosine phosphatase (PTP) superfamily phosphohydrolase (DUF442 family)